MIIALDEPAPADVDPGPGARTATAVSPHLALLRAVEAFTRTLREGGATLARSVDCSRATLAIIRTLQIRGPLPVSEIAQVLRVDISVASRQVSLMVDDGFVERTVDPDDRRVRTIALTAAGRQRTREIEVSLEGRVREIFAGWTPAEIAGATDVLQHLAATIDTAEHPTA
ncbi:MarR family winged helix-turn-helix transcriptional regulator [Cellulomonas sp. PhB150]|uniref:MarR family winged helix-turn-helix transcriptional regulator n=1 Tax=Cellulomonas sp. PhB150 TaxID=2485188 RepID=UPI000F48B9A0|nr:MarR family winged helix-turn-helix transcriptional regulator [Cellulomonas sp. PhB150]ROS31676.1 DNA-binding MarR family transcriptional regulator [Cellulomonas sp. PhB150]